MDSDQQLSSPPEYIDPSAFERLKHELELLTSAIRLVHPTCSTRASTFADGMPSSEPAPGRRRAG